MTKCFTNSQIGDDSRESRLFVYLLKSTYRGRREEDLNMTEKSGRRRTVTSSFKEKSTDQLRNRVIGKVGVFNPPPHHLCNRLMNRYLKTTWMVFLPFRIFPSWCKNSPQLLFYNNVKNTDISHKYKIGGISKELANTLHLAKIILYCIYKK